MKMKYDVLCSPLSVWGGFSRTNGYIIFAKVNKLAVEIERKYHFLVSVASALEPFNDKKGIDDLLQLLKEL